jgi:hypothetical protein
VLSGDLAVWGDRRKCEHTASCSVIPSELANIFEISWSLNDRLDWAELVMR